MRSICFICTGNTCRSPMAEKVLKHLFKVNNIKDVSVISRGLDVQREDKTSSMAIIALKKLGIAARKTDAKPLTKLDLQKKDRIFITMTSSHKAAFNGMKNVYTFSELVGGSDISDPYQLGQEAYDKAANEIFKAAEQIAKQFIK